MTQQSKIPANRINVEELQQSLGGGLELGDIGIAPFGIDETKNTRRYLNGQVISQIQFEAFTSLLKEKVLTYTNLSTTEENWQAEVTNSKLGQCGKFVIDDTAGTIRLPKVVNINGLQDLSSIGGIKAESLPNITGSIGGLNIATTSGAFYNDGTSNGATGNIISLNIKKFDASRSSSTYQDNAPVQQEAVQYPYFIQVATGVEETVNITTEIQLNNPFSLLDYKWSEYEITNASWLLSNGTFHSGSTYVSVYDLLLRIYNGTETKEGVSVKLSTETYGDTDFVLNTADTTFRLPNRTADDFVVDSYDDGTEWYKVYKSGWIEQGGVSNTGETVNFLKSFANTDYSITGNEKLSTTTNPWANTGFKAMSCTTNGFYCYLSNTNNQANIATTVSWYACGKGAEIPASKTYFYVGETVQDANIIAASNVLTNAVMKNSSVDRETVVSWGMPDYSAGVGISSGYTATKKGIIYCYGYYGGNGGSGGGGYCWCKIGNSQTFIVAGGINSTEGKPRSTLPLYINAGETCTFGTVSEGNASGSVFATFYPLKGVK